MKRLTLTLDPGPALGWPLMLDLTLTLIAGLLAAYTTHHAYAMDLDRM